MDHVAKLNRLLLPSTQAHTCARAQLSSFGNEPALQNPTGVDPSASEGCSWASVAAPGPLQSSMDTSSAEPRLSTASPRAEDLTASTRAGIDGGLVYAAGGRHPVDLASTAWRGAAAKPPGPAPTHLTISARANSSRRESSIAPVCPCARAFATPTNIVLSAAHTRGPLRRLIRTNQRVRPAPCVLARL